MYLQLNKYSNCLGCKMNKRVRIVICILFVVGFFIFTRKYLRYNEPASRTTSYLPSPRIYKLYYGIIDAGSTGSRLYMYTVTRGTNNLLEYLKFPDGSIVSHKITPGLADFVNNANDAVEYMLRLFKWLENSVDDKIVGRTSISILATAGMRLLTPNEQNEIINKLKQELPHRTRCKIEDIKVISGIIEGVYQWVANNHLRGIMDDFYNNYNPHKGSNLRTSLTHGIVELGGASLQIVYEKLKTSYHNQIFTYWNPNIGKYSKYKLHSESLLGYGLQTMFNWYLSSENYYSTIDEKSSCLPKYGHLTIRQNDQIVSIVGSGNFELCRQSVEHALIKSGKICKDNDNANNRLFFPNIKLSSTNSNNGGNVLNFDIPQKMELDGFAEVYYGSKEFYNFESPFTNENSKLYIQKAIEFCNTEFSTLQIRLRHGLFNTTNEDNIISQCFKSSYILLLNKIISANDNFITPRFNYQNKEVQWTYGALIDILSQSTK